LSINREPVSAKSKKAYSHDLVQRGSELNSEIDIDPAVLLAQITSNDKPVEFRQGGSMKEHGKS